MNIAHQTVLGADGKPSAALIPWEEFERIQERLGEDDDEAVSEEWRNDLERRVSEIDSSEVELVEGEGFMNLLRAV